MQLRKAHSSAWRCNPERERRCSGWTFIHGLSPAARRRAWDVIWQSGSDIRSLHIAKPEKPMAISPALEAFSLRFADANWTAGMLCRPSSCIPLTTKNFPPLAHGLNHRVSNGIAFGASLPGWTDPPFFFSEGSGETRFWKFSTAPRLGALPVDVPGILCLEGRPVSREASELVEACAKRVSGTLFQLPVPGSSCAALYGRRAPGSKMETTVGLKVRELPQSLAHPLLGCRADGCGSVNLGPSRAADLQLMTSKPQKTALRLCSYENAKLEIDTGGIELSPGQFYWPRHDPSTSRQVLPVTRALFWPKCESRFSTNPPQLVGLLVGRARESWLLCLPRRKTTNPAAP